DIPGLVAWRKKEGKGKKEKEGRKEGGRREGGKEGRKEGRKGGREEEGKRRKEGEREGREGGKEEGRKEGGNRGGREGRREGWKEGRKGGGKGGRGERRKGGREERRREGRKEGRKEGGRKGGGKGRREGGGKGGGKKEGRKEKEKEGEGRKKGKGGASAGPRGCGPGAAPPTRAEPAAVDLAWGRLRDKPRNLAQPRASDAAPPADTAWAGSDACVRSVKKEVGDISILINNAGIVTGKNFLDCPDELMEKALDVNFKAHLWTCKSFLPAMIANNHGHLVCISSSAGLVGISKLADYCASKFAALGFAESIFAETVVQKLNGIKTTIVCPFFINTGMFEGCSTVRPFLLPVLEPEYVVDKIVDAILQEKVYLYVPRFISFVMFLKSILPVKVSLLVADYMGALNIMDGFVGKNKKE
uniref:Short chain dehydrogenase/reductase family 16C member 5 n=1 Tax=Canis lupus familiaris TaxID=9615 RepID=A0A8C0NWY0_CANLF